MEGTRAISNSLKPLNCGLVGNRYRLRGGVIAALKSRCFANVEAQIVCVIRCGTDCPRLARDVG